MQTHPLILYMPYRLVGIISAIACWGTGCLLLYYYTEAGWLLACLDSLVSVGIFSTCGFLFWYVTGILRPVQSRIALVILVQTLVITGGYMIEQLIKPDQIAWFSASIPFRLLFGIMGWIILAQWYNTCWLEFQQEHEVEEARAEIREEEVLSSLSEDSSIDRISVKDGTRIHLIRLDELLYIQACGDYVTLFTVTGQYVKEQTMKYFETHLPKSSFIRIHRSCIVNSGQIIRVELFGKDSYQVRLKTGVCLRVSLTGYRLLKERLSL